MNCLRHQSYKNKNTETKALIIYKKRILKVNKRPFAKLHGAIS